MDIRAFDILLLLCICIPLFVHFYRNHDDRQREARISNALISMSPSPLRDIDVTVDRGTVHLSGTAPNEYQRQRAEEIAAQVSPGMIIDNAIIAGSASPFPILLKLRTEEIVAALNTVNGIYLESHFDNGDLLLTGVAADSSLLAHITRTFEELPGLHTFANRVKAGEMEIARRLLFDINSVTIRPIDREAPAVVKGILDRTPWSKLLIIGHSDEVGGEVMNRRIATGRATAAQLALRMLGVRSDRILIEGKPGPPSGSAATGADSLSRCVRFILLPTNVGGPE